MRGNQIMEPQASSWLGEWWCWLEAHAEVLRNLAFSLSLSLAATLGTVLLVIRTVAANRTSKAALKQSEISEQSQITERFSKAVELLGHEDVSVRLGAIYALERIARDSPRDHWTIMETLMAYTRKERDSVLDAQAVLVVISRRETSNDPPSAVIDLSKSYLQSVSAHHLQLPDAVMIKANLEEADLRKADLLGANLRGANLQQAKLLGTNLQQANLQQANLEQAKLQTANLQEANLQQANLRGANLQGAHLLGTNLQQANLQQANLRGAINLDCGSLEFARSWELAFRDPELACGAEIPKRTE